MALEQELETFHRELPGLLKDPANLGKYVLIHRGQVNGVWPTVDAALDAGYERFGVEPFLVKEITEHEQPQFFSRNITRCP